MMQGQNPLCEQLLFPNAAAVSAPLASKGSAQESAQDSEFGRDLLACLRQRPHTIAPKYFYDDQGSQLFEQICALPEYYVTRTELSIFRRHVAAMAAAIGPQAEIIEFGAGSLMKARLLLDALEAPYRFVAIDISGAQLASAAAMLRRDYPLLEVEPLAEDFTCLEALPLWQAGPGRRVGFFPGSTIGNLSPELARRFLCSAARLLRGGGLLIGVDLVKAPKVLHAAYNDADGITAAFNRNLLARANRELGSNFQVDNFEHYAFYNAGLQRIEMHLIAARAQQVALFGQHFQLLQGESIHTENSHKYTVEGFQTLAEECGFRPKATWCDSERWFSVHWLESAV
jgi:dimethylhistidine N-methyltransferase